MKIGILKERKVPPDRRVPLTPQQCQALLSFYPKLQIELEASDIRCFVDSAYAEVGVVVKSDISSCDLFIGIKEVPKEHLVEGKTYLFFSHTIKKQKHNREMLKAILAKKIRLIDFELLVDNSGKRVIGFGRYAGAIGTYNGLLTYGKKYGLYNLKPVQWCSGKAELFKELKKVKLPIIRIAVTGNGRVASGAVEVLEELNIKRVSVDHFLSDNEESACYVQLTPADYNLQKFGWDFDLQHFFIHPEEYKSNFKRFCSRTDLLISAAFWDPNAPILFTFDDVQDNGFRIKVIADISCDVDGAIPTTIRSTSIVNPVYDFNRKTLQEQLPYSDLDNITVMAVDNLPCELPVDASREFGSHLVNRVLDFIINKDRHGMIERATITEDGKLKERFQYLQDFVNNKNT